MSLMVKLAYSLRSLKKYSDEYYHLQYNSTTVQSTQVNANTVAVIVTQRKFEISR